MVTIQIYDTGQVLEAKDAKITYVKTAGDLGELTRVNSSYSWTMKFPKTPNNTQVLDGLGLVGSGSRKPYEKIYCNLLDNGFPITVKGLLNIKETTDEYGIYVQEGFIDFLKDITNDTVGGNLDLSPLDHTRDYSTITGSFNLSLPYAYLVADVNGGYLLNQNDTTNLNSEYMAPYANVGYIWDLIFSTYGWSFSFNNDVRDNIDNLWMSYPSEIVFSDEDAVVIGQLSASNSYGVPIGGSRKNQGIVFDTVTLDNTYIIPTNTNGREFTIQQNGNYKISFDSLGDVRLEDQYGNITQTTYKNYIYINGQRVLSTAGSDSDDTMVTEVQMQLNQGDVIQLGAYVLSTELDTSVQVDTANMEISYLSQGEVSFTQALINYKISDFIKEIMTRESLTPFVDSDNRHIEFLTLKERVNYNVRDWSRWYSNRLSETYLYRDYAQNNYMRHQYDEDNEEFNDGNLPIDNANLDTEKTIYDSKSFSPSREFSTFSDNGNDYKVPRLKMFDAEVNDDDGVITIDYKFLKDRFFFVNHSMTTRDIYVDGNLVEGFPMVSVNGCVFKDIVNNKYDDFKSMVTDAKVHTIELSLPLSEVVTLDMREVIYFEQEASFYILNKLTYNTGSKSKAEFLRIDRAMNGVSKSNGAFSGAFNNSFNT